LEKGYSGEGFANSILNAAKKSKFDMPTLEVLSFVLACIFSHTNNGI
jgi:hypothetical protein